VIADVRVAVREDAVLLEVDRRIRSDLVDALGRLIIADDVELCDPTEPLALVGLDGARAPALLGEPLANLAPYAIASVPVAGVPVDVVRASEVRGAGFVLHVSESAVTRVWDALVVAGARPCGTAALEGRRIEVGVPRIGIDMDGKTLALEVPVDETISATKGCYLGQEVIARGTARGHVNRRLTGLLLDGPRPPSGAPLVRDGKEVGHVTSVGRAFGIAVDAALGFVRREQWEPGTVLGVRHGHAVTVARVAALPLV